MTWIPTPPRTEHWGLSGSPAIVRARSCDRAPETSGGEHSALGSTVGAKIVKGWLAAAKSLKSASTSSGRAEGTPLRGAATGGWKWWLPRRR